jgi:hypothetical protein
LARSNKENEDCQENRGPLSFFPLPHIWRIPRFSTSLFFVGFVVNSVLSLSMLEAPDSHCLRAAIGWMELGNPAEGEAELNQISPAGQQHPDVLEVRWLLCSEQRNWEGGLQVARTLVAVAPERASGWLHRAYALRRVPGGGLKEAREALLPAADKFPKEALIPFNLSCYACQLGDLADALQWLKRAMRAGQKGRVKLMALADPDLQPIWSEIRKLK